MEPSIPIDRSRREWLAVAVVTAVGLGLRLWPIGGLGLTHFDEGIYALAATWSLHPRGLAAIDPGLIPYAPPGYPILAGMACWLLGKSDGAMIAVSQLAGTLTIPVVAMLGRRAFGPGAGFAAATFCAFSGPHVASSRMALTDASFLLAWLLALGSGMRFLERPGPPRALLMGLAVGLAQQFKYNGWLAGGIVVASAALGALVRPESRGPGPIARTFGWGVLAAVVAWLVVWPWFAFVEAHGGYPALLRHQQSYLGGLDRWWPNLWTQSDQAIALSGGAWLILPVLILAAAAPWFVPSAGRPACLRSLPASGRMLLVSSSVAAAWFFAESPFFLGLAAFSWLASRPGPSVRVVGVWWLAMAASSPFYHPYARLWLPLHACNWLLLGWWFAGGPLDARGLDALERDRPRPCSLPPVATACLVLGLVGGVARIASQYLGQARAQPGLLSPSDSLYRAAVEVARSLPEGVGGLRVLARPPVIYYLAGRVATGRMAGSDDLRVPGDRSTWALVDSAILRSESGVASAGSGRDLLDRFADRWEVVGEFPTTLALPTLLDLDPGAARRRDADRSCPLWLLRPRTSKGPR